MLKKAKAMDTTKFIFIIDAERHYNILIRIISTFTRNRVPIIDFNSSVKSEGELLHINFSIQDTKENAVKLSKKLEREIDILTVNVFEQLIDRYAK